MKKLSLILAVALAATFTSCSLPTRLTNTAAYVEGEASQPIAAVYADIEVSPKKVKYFYIPKASVLVDGKENVVNTAVREALLASNNADLMICLEKQIVYNEKGKIQSVTVTGYPAKYKNFRSPSDEHLLELLKRGLKTNAKSGGANLLGGLKLGK